MADIDEKGFVALQNQVKSLASDVLALQNTLKSHQHLAQDGTSKTEAKVNLKASTLYLSGGASLGGPFFTLPFSIYDNQNKPADGTGKRAAGMQVSITNPKGAANEQDEMVLTVGKDTVSASDIFDFTTFNFSQLSVLHLPQDIHLVNGQVSTAPYSFFVGVRTPFVESDDKSNPATGVITKGGTALTDATLALDPGSIVGCRINLYDAGGFREAYPVVANSATTITISGTWVSSSGNYYYEVYTPMFLGSADNPWRRLYVDNEGGMAIRFGQGPTSGKKVAGIYYSSVNMNPNGNVVANPGSIFLNLGGGVGATFFVKESGIGTATGWIGK